MNILSPAAIKKIQCLLVHIRKGCLSGIPPGHGTNRNERLHRDLNHCLGHSRYGVELAYGLITSVFFSTIMNKYQQRMRKGTPSL